MTPWRGRSPAPLATRPAPGLPGRPSCRAGPTPDEGPRYLSDDGSRLFFESRDALSAADQNERRDVYEFERAGAGSCDAEDPGFDPISAGCLSLVSSGNSEDESYLVDASSSGRDVFLSTRERLSGWDTNEDYDVYDARVQGGFPEPSTAPSCGGEACLPPPPPAPGLSAPATPGFQGPGNAAHKPAKKHKAKPRKKHKHKHKAKKHGRTTTKRKAGR